MADQEDPEVRLPSTPDDDKANDVIASGTQSNPGGDDGAGGGQGGTSTGSGSGSGNSR